MIYLETVVTLAVPEHSSCGAPFLEHPPGLRLVREAVDEAEEALLWRLVSWDRDCRGECQDQTWQLFRKKLCLGPRVGYVLVWTPNTSQLPDKVLSLARLQPGNHQASLR